MNTYRQIDLDNQRAEAFLANALEMALHFVEKRVHSGKPLTYFSANAIRGRFLFQIPQQGVSDDTLLWELENLIIDGSICQSAKGFIAFPDVSTSYVALAGAIIEPFLNQNLISFERGAPTASFVEMQVISWLRQLVGFRLPDPEHQGTVNHIGGLCTTGGVMSNHIAILTAMAHAFPGVYNAGLRSLKQQPTIVLAKDIAHFSFAAAARTLGLGDDSLVWAKSSAHCKTDVDSVERLLDTIKADDRKVFMIVAVAGNCRTTSIDDIQPLSKLCHSRGIWLHVDACHGGSLLFDQELRNRWLHGIENVDSISVDPHKGMNIPYPSSYVLFRNTTALNVLSRYPDRLSQEPCYDIGLITPFFGSRSFTSLRLWMQIRALGIEGMATLVRKRQLNYTRVLAALEDTQALLFLNSPDFYRTAATLRPGIDLSNVSTTYVTAISQLISVHNRRVAQRLYEGGEVIVDLFAMADLGNIVGMGNRVTYDVIGISVGHFEMSEDNITIIVRSLTAAAEDEQRQLKQNILRIIAEQDAIVNHDKKHVLGPAGWR